MIITISSLSVKALLNNLIEIHDQIEGLFKTYAMVQSACPELVFFRNDKLLKKRSFLVNLKLFSLGTLSQFLAYLDIACINSNEIHEQNKVFFML